MGELTPAELEQRRTAAVTHGAHSDAQISPIARSQKRRMLRQIGLSAADLDGVGRAYLDSWARCQAKVELMDRWAAENGWLDEEGKPPPFAAFYLAAVNSARLAITKFAEHQKARGGDPSMVAVLQGNARRVDS